MAALAFPSGRWTRGRSAFAGKLCALGGLALVLRLLHVHSLCGALDNAQIRDAAYYHDVALRLHGRQLAADLDGPMAFANLGYPYVLTWVYTLGGSPTAVLVVQAVIGAFTAMLTGLLARQLFRNVAVGLWAAALYACYAPAIFYDGLLLTPSLSAFLAAALGWSLLSATRKRRAGWLLLFAGALIGAAALLRASQVLWLPLAVATVTFTVQKAKTRAVGALLLLLGATVCVAPVILSQRVKADAWFPITTNGGMNFWIGNHQGASGSYATAPFLGNSQGGDYQHTLIVERDRFLAEARRRSGEPALSLAGASHFWWRETWREIAIAPSRWLAVLGRKLLRALNDYESPTNAGLELMQEVSPSLRWNPLRFGLLATLAVLGATQLRRRRYVRARWVLGTLVFAPGLTCLLFFVSGEYRHPAAVALAVLAGCGVQRLPWLFTLRTGLTWVRRALPPLVVAGLAFLPVVKLGPAADRKAYAEALVVVTSEANPPDLERYALARALLAKHGDSLQDQVLAAEALLLVESNQAIQFQDRAAAQRLIQTAEELWGRALKPGRDLDAATVSRVRQNLVRRIAQLSRQPFVSQSAQAGWAELLVPAAQAAVRQGPYDESLQYVLGNLMLAQGSGQSVVEFFSAELARDQKPQTSHYFIAMGLAKQGDVDGAVRQFQRALAIDPAHEMSQRQWGLLLEQQGQLVPALEHLVEATRIHPEYRAALLDVARLAGRLGHPEQAARWLERARAATPDTPRRFVYWARYLQQHGRNRAALAELARRLEQTPDDAEALELRRTMLATEPRR